MAKKKLFDHPEYPNLGVTSIGKQEKMFDQLEGTPISRNRPEPPIVDPFKQSGNTQIVLGNVPAKSNCYRIITFKSKDKSKQHASLAKMPELRAYENAFILQAGLYRNRNIDTEFAIELVCYYPTKRSDLDNSLKVILDCLQKINAIKNDNLCVEIHAKKRIDKDNPRVEFSLQVLTKTD